MSFRTAILSAAAAVDDIRGPSGLDVAPYTVDVVTRTWTSGIRGDLVGGFTDSKLAPPLPRSTKVRAVSTREIAGSGGQYRTGDLRIGPIRPKWTQPVTGKTGGFTAAQLAPTFTVDGIEFFYRLSQQYTDGAGEAGDYQLVELARDRFAHFTAIVRRQLQPAGDPTADTP